MPTGVVQISDVVIEPSRFTSYIAENSFVSTNFYRSGVAMPNAVMQEQLAAGSESFTVPTWTDAGEDEPNYSSDVPTSLASTLKISAYPQVVRKAFINQAWSESSLAAELSGSSPLARIQSRVLEYWNRHMERRIIASLNGILAANIANNNSDMVVDVTSTSVPGFNATAVIDAALTLGDRLEDCKAIALHSSVYGEALINNEIQFIPQSEGLPIKTYRGMAVVLDDNLWYSDVAGVIKYVSVLFGYGAIGYGFAPPRTGFGTELFRVPSAGMGGGVTQLWSRYNVAVSALGFSWSDGAGLTNDSPSLADLATASHWTRVSVSRKNAPLAFLLTK